MILWTLLKLLEFLERAKPASKEYTIPELEALHLPVDDGRVPHVPFGFMNGRWEEFKLQWRDGDKIFEFSSPTEAWKHLEGREGYVLVRREKVIATIITRVS
jgi:hypothetical protein